MGRRFSNQLPEHYPRVPPPHLTWRMQALAGAAAWLTPGVIAGAKSAQPVDFPGMCLWVTTGALSAAVLGALSGMVGWVIGRGTRYYAYADVCLGGCAVGTLVGGCAAAFTHGTVSVPAGLVAGALAGFSPGVLVIMVEFGTNDRTGLLLGLVGVNAGGLCGVLLGPVAVWAIGLASVWILVFAGSVLSGSAMAIVQLLVSCRRWSAVALLRTITGGAVRGAVAGALALISLGAFFRAVVDWSVAFALAGVILGTAGALAVASIVSAIVTNHELVNTWSQDVID